MAIKNPASPTDGAERTCTYSGHQGVNPLPASEEHFPVRKTGARAGTFIGWCHSCQKLHGEAYREAKKNGTVKTRARKPVLRAYSAARTGDGPAPATVTVLRPRKRTPKRPPARQYSAVRAA